MTSSIRPEIRGFGGPSTHPGRTRDEADRMGPGDADLRRILDLFRSSHTAIASVDAGSGGLGSAEIVGLVMVVLGAPALNTLADYTFRQLR